MQNTLTMDLLNSTSMTKIFNFELYKVKNQDKEDVKQDCILRIMKALNNTEEVIPEDKLPSFCQTIIKRTVVDYYRKCNRMIDQATMLVNYSDAFSDDGDDDGSSFAQEVFEYGYDLSEVRLDYSLNKAKFTPREREVLDYFLLTDDGFSMNLTEIARDLQVNKSHATRAVQKLREICK